MLNFIEVANAKSYTCYATSALERNVGANKQRVSQRKKQEARNSKREKQSYICSQNNK